jgi:hypothetical protein
MLEVLVKLDQLVNGKIKPNLLSIKNLIISKLNYTNLNSQFTPSITLKYHHNLITTIDKRFLDYLF